jgi:hypothetical protein
VRPPGAATTYQGRVPRHPHGSGAHEDDAHASSPAAAERLALQPVQGTAAAAATASGPPSGDASHPLAYTYQAITASANDSGGRGPKGDAFPMLVRAPPV